jgi:hypothetical protein
MIFTYSVLGFGAYACCVIWFPSCCIQNAFMTGIAIKLFICDEQFTLCEVCVQDLMHCICQ